MLFFHIVLKTYHQLSLSLNICPLTAHLSSLEKGPKTHGQSPVLCGSTEAAACGLLGYSLLGCGMLTTATV